jgi:ankyrin repeat protein
MHPETLRLLLARGANPNARDSRDRTPLWYAVRACVDSYWKQRRTPECVAALLQAGSTLHGIDYPCGYDEVDALLEAKLKSMAE